TSQFAQNCEPEEEGIGVPEKGTIVEEDVTSQFAQNCEPEEEGIGVPEKGTIVEEDVDKMASSSDGRPRQNSQCKKSSMSSSSSSSSSTSSTENILESELESRSSQVGTSTLRSRVRTSTPQASTLFSSRDALGDSKDEAEDKFEEDTWFTLEDKRNKMTKESIIELLEEFPLPPPFFARVPALQEPSHYGTDLETSVYEGQIRSGYKIPMHPFAVAFFNYCKMAPGQLVPNKWRKLVGFIY
ncbi:hypothetical protein RJ639_013200, partial [Escallonia herrerae]